MVMTCEDYYPEDEENLEMRHYYDNRAILRRLEKLEEQGKSLFRRLDRIIELLEAQIALIRIK